jgi:predicted lysophospholipase L1 biosynthesis ABC-type transport system permease subunit
MRTPIVAGRAIDWTDIEHARPVMMVSESLAAREWGTAAAAIGRRISPTPNEQGSEIIGVFKDVRHNGLHQPAPEAAALVAVGSDTATFVLRSARVGSSALVSDVRNAVWSVAPDVSLARVRSLDELYDQSMARTSMILSLLATTGTLALALGLIGIYGVVSHAVSERRHEIGVRLALGARHGDVTRLFVKRALVLVGTGIVIGLGAASALTRLMESQVFGVRPLDPATHAAAAVALAVAATCASYLSARRGTALDPLTVLRAE